MIIFNPSTSQSTAINFREKAPAAASVDMFHGNRTLALLVHVLYNTLYEAISSVTREG